ncbi:peroxidase [Helicosporidium sp. ATCC 50920]|nr:peroxidase [Helicosporidium sp. ATCC 50920]|eukprot:KDD76719.1 peroxidase [Helicosporidium sp. ATCC 50920]
MSHKLPLILALSGGLGGLYYAKQQGLLDGFSGGAPSGKTAKPDYDKVRSAIEDLLESNPDYDDGSYGPLLVRLAWHTSGTWDKNKKTGGSNGATMRFSPESNWGANAGLNQARDLLEPVKKAFPWISYSDLWTLAGAVAIEAMGGPHIRWRAGRSDVDENNIVILPDGLLPDATQGAKHLRDVFYRMGFNDQEIVALSGGHTLGRCHTDRSGFTGPWTFAPTTFSNMFFTELKNNKWSKKRWKGPLQYEDKSGELMMLPTDMALIWDKKFKPFVDLYADDGDKFAADFAEAFAKLLELGVPFEKNAEEGRVVLQPNSHFVEGGAAKQEGAPAPRRSS